MGSQEFYAYKMMETARLINVERIQQDGVAMRKHLIDAIQLSTIMVAWLDLTSGDCGKLNVNLSATVNGKKPDMMGKCGKDTVILRG